MFLPCLEHQRRPLNTIDLFRFHLGLIVGLFSRRALGAPLCDLLWLRR